jgi:capsid protein
MASLGLQIQRDADTLAFLDQAARGQARFNTNSGYDAVVDQGRRKRASGVNRSEDQELTPFDRYRLYTGARDIARNFSIAGWMIRQHLDYVSTFTFRPRCKTTARNDELQRWFDWWSQPENCDAAARHGFFRFLRLAERSRVVDGDLLVLKLADGRLQAIEGDRIRTPVGGFPANAGRQAVDFLHGVQTDEAGKAVGYSVCRRAKASDYMIASGMFFFEAIVLAEDCWHHGYFDRFDQVRGVSPLAQAMNSLRDTYEGVDYALAKMKVSQIFALALYRDNDQPVGAVSAEAQALIPAGQFNPTLQMIDDTDVPQDAVKINFGRGPMQLDLEKGDKAEFLESHQPSIELQSFLDNVVAASLKALDIPFSFFKENFTNYSGGRDARTRYEHSARLKRADNVHLANRALNWRLDLACEDGELSGSPEDYGWDLLPSGVPWIDPLKEVQADTQALAACFTSRTRVCREQGTDFRTIAQEIKEENDYLRELGLPTEVNPSNVELTEVVGAGGGE